MISKLCTFAVLLVVSAAACFAEKPTEKISEKATFTEAGHTTDSPEVVKQRVKDKQAVLLDVREQDEWDAGHLKLARLLPFSQIRKGQLTDEQKKLLPQDKPIYCHCASGGRVLSVSKILRAKGYDVRPLKAGYADLLQKDFEQAQDKPEGSADKDAVEDR